MTVKLNDGDAFVVMPVEKWRHMIEVYKTLALEAKSDDDYAAWMDVHDHLVSSVDNTATDDYGDEN